MDESAVKSEKLERFDDAEMEDEAQDDPNEVLESSHDGLNGSVWLIKVPKKLMEKWSAVQEAGVHLATLRIYEAADGQQQQKMQILLPDNPEYDTGNEPKDWEFVMDDPSKVHSQWIMSDQPKAGSLNRRARNTALKGRVTTRGRMMRSHFTEEYGAKMRERSEAVKPKRHVKILNDTAGDSGPNLKMLQSGALQTKAGFNTGAPRAGGSSSSSKPTAKDLDKAIRSPRNELFDALFALFAETPYLSLKEIRKKTQNPEAWIKELLSEMADFNQGGPNHNMYSLKASLRSEVDGRASTSGGAGLGTAVKSEVKGEEDEAGASAMVEDDDTDFDDEDEDMEEIGS
ncbi:hypothetical protein DL93DRAFT_2199406 [Clavulina sp. PMI_390]|nr:hypothetical protein DL93DRAFT_2199406 [Clavulina sp. PMI_390]